VQKPLMNPVTRPDLSGKINGAIDFDVSSIADDELKRGIVWAARKFSGVGRVESQIRAVASPWRSRNRTAHRGGQNPGLSGWAT
jgi:hypothetical protein